MNGLWATAVEPRAKEPAVCNDLEVPKRRWHRHGNLRWGGERIEFSACKTRAFRCKREKHKGRKRTGSRESRDQLWRFGNLSRLRRGYKGVGVLGGRPRGNTRVRGRREGGQARAPDPGICSHLFLQDPIVEIADKDAEEAERQAQPVGHQGAASGHETPGRPDRRPAHSRQRQRRRRRQLQPDIADRRQGTHRSCMRPLLSRPQQPPPELPVQGLRRGNASGTQKPFPRKGDSSWDLGFVPGGRESQPPRS